MPNIDGDAKLSITIIIIKQQYKAILLPSFHYFLDGDNDDNDYGNSLTSAPGDPDVPIGPWGPSSPLQKEKKIFNTSTRIFYLQLQ